MVKKALICALAASGLAAGAHAADLDLGSVKDPLPDGSLTWRGVTLYGAIDVGVAYQSHGAPMSGALATGLEYNIIGSNNLHVNNLWAIAPNGLSQSFVGLKMEEKLAYGWTAVGKIESGFVPTSGEIADGCASLQRANGKNQFEQFSKGDSSRCGQIFNGPAYVGISNPSYGTVTVGRQNSLLLDAMAVYDPQQLSYAFSLFGYTGSTDGTGDTQSARWDNSVKYVYQYGPVHAAAMYTAGGADSPNFGPAFGFNAGVTWQGFSIDGVYDNAKGIVSANSLSATACTGLGLTVVTCPGVKILAGTISDNEVWSIMGKYTYDFGGGYKDSGPSSKLTFYVGYENIDFADPSTTVLPGQTTIGGYVLGTVNNLNYRTDRIIDVFWTGATYEIGSWRATLAYYYEHQNSFLTGAASENCATVTAANRGTAGFIGSPIGANCSGNLNTVSFVVDYTFTQHFDIYAGVEYSDVDGGLGSGFIQDNVTTVMSGFRLRF